jgi:hypothetical protein
MEQRPSWEVKRSSAIQEIPRVLWNPKVYYRIHKSLSQIDPVHSTSRRSILVLSFYLRLDLPSGTTL